MGVIAAIILAATVRTGGNNLAIGAVAVAAPDACLAGTTTFEGIVFSIDRQTTVVLIQRSANLAANDATDDRADNSCSNTSPAMPDRTPQNTASQRADAEAGIGAVATISAAGSQ